MTQSNIPIPDPSVITTAQIDKARLELKAEIASAVATLERIIITRLEAMDKADILFAEDLHRVPTLLDREVERLTMIIDMKYKHNQELFEEMFRARDLAISTSSAAIIQRLEVMNEFREQLSHQMGRLINRDEHGVVLDQLSKLQIEAQSDISRFMSRDEMASLRIAGEKQDIINMDIHSQINSRLSALEGKFYIGGAGIVIIMTTMQLLLNYLHVT